MGEKLMTAIITITEMSSMPGRFIYTLKSGRIVIKGNDAGSDPEAAAAKAMDLAVCYGSQYGYAIFAPKKVINLIPQRLRSGVPTQPCFAI